MSQSQQNSFDVIIIGAGPAGISAALWCDELGLSALLLELGQKIGGQLLRTFNAIENYPGIETTNGVQLGQILGKQLGKRTVDLRLNCEVKSLDLGLKTVTIETGECFSARSIILATGVRRRKLNIQNEEKFLNHGILLSGSNEKERVIGKVVCVVGGGDAALENALILAENARTVFLIHRRDSFSARPEFIKRVRSAANISTMLNSIVKEIRGSERLESLIIGGVDSQTETFIETDFLLLRLGVDPNNELFRDQIKIDKFGYIKIDANCLTSLPEIYAIGDIANRLAPTITSAVGMGATAAKVIFSNQ